MRSGDSASIGTYTASMAQADGTPHSQWFRLAQNDVAIISIEVTFLDSCSCLITMLTCIVVSLGLLAMQVAHHEPDTFNCY